MIKIKLKPNHEIVGVLKGINNTNNSIELIFQVTHNIEVSKDIVLYEKLKQLHGNKISLLNIDGDYRVREIRDKAINSRHVPLKYNFSEDPVRKSKCTFEDRYKLVVSEVDDFLDRWKQDKKSKSVIKSGGDDGS